LLLDPIEAMLLAMRSSSLMAGVVPVVALVSSVRADDGSKQVRFIGIHPVAVVGGGICHIEGPHVHAYAVDPIQYREHRGHHHFVGDPVAYGFDGPKFAYHGHHPIHVHAVVGSPEPDIEFCYLDGPHYHYFEPPSASVDFKLEGGAYFFVGEPPAVYLEARPKWIAINATYRPLRYRRPVITVTPPAGWIGARVAVGSAGVVRAGVNGLGVGLGAGVDFKVKVGVDVGVGVGGKVKIKSDNGRYRGHHKHKR
jgi:hypothetical protein